MSNMKSAEIQDFFKAILTLENLGECEKFFEDICTIKELDAISQRLNVAKMLDKGIVYTEIAQKTGASTATITRVNRAKNFGAGGYDLVLEKLEKVQNREGI